MRKKSLSISEISLSRPRIARPLSILTCPNNPDRQETIFETQFMSENPNRPQREHENFKIRKIQPIKSVSHKNLSSLKPKEESKCPPNLLEQLNTIDKCRKVFDKIIARDKKYGEVLAKIKEVYEKELEKTAEKKVENRIKLNLTGIHKSDKRKKELTVISDAIEKLGKNRLESDKNIRDGVNVDTASDLETIYTSGRGNVPELTLGNIERADFHEEFMANYNNFSESWRKLAKK